MAVRLPSGAFLRHAAGPATANFSFLAWVRLPSVSNWQTVLCLDTGAGNSNTIAFQFDAGRINFFDGNLFSNTAQINSPTIAANVWTCVGFTLNGAAVKTYIRAHTSATWTTNTGTRSNTHAPTRTTFGESVYGSEYLAGDLIAPIMASGVTWTDAEMLAQSFYAAPLRHANIWAYYRLAAPGDYADLSGNARTLTATGTPTLQLAAPNAFNWRVNKTSQRRTATGPSILNKSVPANAILQEVLFKAVPANSVLQEKPTKSVPANAVLQEKPTKSVPANAVLREELAAQVPANAVLREPAEAAVPANAVLREEIIRQALANAVLQEPGDVQVDANAVLQDVRALSAEASAVLLEVLARSLPANAVLLEKPSVQVDANAILLERRLLSLLANAVLEEPGAHTIQLEADAVLLEYLQKSVPANAVLLEKFSHSLLANAVLREAFSRSVPANTVLLERLSLSLLANAYLEETGLRSLQLPANAVLQAALLRSLPANAYLAGDPAEYPAKARILSMEISPGGAAVGWSDGATSVEWTSGKTEVDS